jgi:glutathione synthase/RimK-type ligase-like ATP-grasp enzyme
MRKSRFVLLTGNRGFFGQTRKAWVSMDVGKMVRVFEVEGLKPEVLQFHAVVNGHSNVRDADVFYTFSQKPNLRQYIIDTVRHLDDGTNRLIPRYDLLLCHENKGYQELVKRRLGIESLAASYYSSEDDLAGIPVRFPVVLKSVDTSNGKGVFLVRNEAELKKRVRGLERQSLGTRLDLFRRKTLRRKKRYPAYPDYDNRTDYIQYRKYALKERNFVLQEYVPDLTWDWRVQAMAGKYYVIRRRAFENDFRASGTKLHEFGVEADPALLDFADGIFRKIDAPFLSMDIGSAGKGFCLFEFQALHFGVNSVVQSTGYYRRDGSAWRFIQARSEIETEIASGLVRYLDGREPD